MHTKLRYNLWLIKYKKISIVQSLVEIGIFRTGFFAGRGATASMIFRPGLDTMIACRRRLGRPARAVAAMLAMLAMTPAGAAHAIPSPELVVGSLTSLSQLGALLSALLGGSAAFAIRGRGGKPQGSRWWMRLAVALAAICVLLGALNVFQWQSTRDERHQRLSATLTKPSRLAGQPQLDKSLKELGPAEQASHPLGMTPEEAETLVPRARELAYEIIDIRESAEVEMGTFEGARSIRYPDFLAGHAQIKAQKALLICHNGNRSSETCQALKERGIDCRFIIGGLERWIAEGRRAGGFHRTSVLEARAVPPYPNNDRLIDTNEMHGLIEEEGAVIVDTRYPGEFAAGHLPGAINIPMRRMTTPEVEAAMQRLPRRPVVVACYDRRSCFFGELVGLELWRKGRDFRGRYTVPWEYAPRMPPPAHIAAALAERNLGTWARARRWLAQTIDMLASDWGFLAVLLGMALASRIVILPFALKAERDQIVAARIEPEMQRLKQELADDSTRRMRAIRQLYRRHGLTPLVNLLALLGLPVLMLVGMALGDAAALGGHAHPLLGPLAKPDPTWLIAISGAALIGLYVEWALCRTRRQRLIAWLGLVPGLLVVLGYLPAATNLYVAASAVLLLAQRAVVTGLPRAAFRWVERRLQARSSADGVVMLALAAGRTDVGNKASRLGAMIAAGMPVPDGVVLTPELLSRWRIADPGERSRLARRVAQEVGQGPFAVRSSGAAEDQADASHAGVFESVTDVAGADLAAAIDRVVASFGSGRALHYAMSEGVGAVIVQRMIQGRHGGVLFTRAPDAPGLSLVEMVDGGAEALVSGRGKPMAYRFGRRSGQSMDDKRAPLDLGPLLALGRDLEARFGAPQDIEWVCDGRRIWLVQSRDITANASALAPCVLAEWDRLLELAGEAEADPRTTLARNEMCEMLPRPTAATRSLVEALHASGGSVDLACRALGLGYRVEEASPPLFPTLFGRLYHNAAEAGRRAPRLTRLDIRRIRRHAESLEARMRGEVLPAIEASVLLPAATRFEALATRDLHRVAGEIAGRFVTVTHVEAEIVNIVTEVVVAEARKGLLAAGREPARWLARHGETLEEAALSAACGDAAGESDSSRMRGLAHRATLDYELAHPRFAEDAAALAARLNAHRSHMALVRPPMPGTGGLDAHLATTIELARRLQTLKEDVKHVALMELAVLRKVFLALDGHLGLDGRIFCLTIEEIGRVGCDPDEARALVEKREAEQEAIARSAPLPARPTLVEIERHSWLSAARGDPARGSLTGMRVAGTRRATGRALVVDDETAEAGGPLAGFEPGDVIVAPFIHPAWLGEVLSAAGVVAGSGGWLSHMAIVARERDVAMIVGVDGWTRIAPGERVTLELDGSVRIQASDAERVISDEIAGERVPG